VGKILSGFQSHTGGGEEGRYLKSAKVSYATAGENTKGPMSD